MLRPLRHLFDAIKASREEYSLKMPVRWSETETIRFVRLYKDRQCLWDPALPDYRNNKVRQEAYEELQREVGIEGFSIGDVKQKIKNLRNTYSQEVNKIEKAIHCGYTYVPQMKWFKTMDEVVRKIRDNEPSIYFRDKPQKNGLPKREEHEDVCEIELCSDKDEVDAEETVFQEQQPTIFQEQESPIFHEQPNVFQEEAPVYSHGYANHLYSPEPTPSSGPARKRRRTVVSSALQKLEQVNQSLLEFLEDEDEWDAFGNFVGLSLKRLPLEMALEAQSEIHATLAKFKRLQHRSSHGNSQGSRGSGGGGHHSAFSATPRSRDHEQIDLEPGSPSDSRSATTLAPPQTAPEPTLTFYMNEKDGVQCIEGCE